MKHFVLLVLVAALYACGTEKPATTDANEATELRDWAQGYTSRAEITAKLAETRMALRVIEQSDPGGSEAQRLKEEIDRLEKALDALTQSARQ